MHASTDITIELNGSAKLLPVGTTIATLVAMTLQQPRGYAVELNLSVVPRRDHATTEVRAGDKVEIVTLVGGG